MDKNKQAKKDLSEILLEQILEIRDSGEANMFDGHAVQRIANDRGFYELVCFMEDHPIAYSRFIISGDKNLLKEP